MIALESVNLFRSLNSDELQALRAFTREERFAAGAGIFREGDAGDGVYVVKDGRVEISALVNQAARHVFSQLGPGEIFGEMAVVEQQPRSATAVAVKDTIVYFIPRAEMRVLLQRSPAFAFSLLQEICRRLREFDQLHLREVVQAERLAVLGSFAHSVFHDIKTPLTVIGLSAEIACRADATAERRALSEKRIHKQIARINDMIGDIIEFTRTRQSETLPGPAGYPDFVRELLPDLAAEAEAKSAQIELQNEPPPVLISFDASRLRRVFFNLLHNAFDVMPGGGKVILRFLSGDQEIITEVEDTGPGIAPEMLDKLFQPFATHGKNYGTGLGLSICKKILEDHKGRIWTRAEPGRGAIFCFALPLAQ